MTIADAVDQAVPIALLQDLRMARHRDPDQHHAVLDAWELRSLTGGRNNDVYAWNGICIKLYRRTDRRRVEREWHGLIHVTDLNIAPQPLWLDLHPDQPALGMTLLPGTAAPEHTFPADALPKLAAATHAMQQLPLRPPLIDLPRVDSIEHYLQRVATIWPAQLAATSDDPLTPDLLALLNRWQVSSDATILRRPATTVFSRGDANLLNWLHHHTLHVVDFEFAGHSDPATDAADHIEHISARHIPDTTWTTLEPDLGIDRYNRARYHAARRTIALRWLAVLWKQRHHRTKEFTNQLTRTTELLT